MFAHLQEEVFGPVSMCMKLALADAVKCVKGKASAERGSVADAVCMAKALVVILGNRSRASKMEDAAATIKSLLYLQKHAQPADAEIFLMALCRIQQGRIHTSIGSPTNLSPHTLSLDYPPT